MNKFYNLNYLIFFIGNVICILFYLFLLIFYNGFILTYGKLLTWFFILTSWVMLPIYYIHYILYKEDKNGDKN